MKIPMYRFTVALDLTWDVIQIFCVWVAVSHGCEGINTILLLREKKIKILSRGTIKLFMSC